MRAKDVHQQSTQQRALKGRHRTRGTLVEHADTTSLIDTVAPTSAVATAVPPAVELFAVPPASPGPAADALAVQAVAGGDASGSAGGGLRPLGLGCHCSVDSTATGTAVPLERPWARPWALTHGTARGTWRNIIENT